MKARSLIHIQKDKNEKYRVTFFNPACCSVNSYETKEAAIEYAKNFIFEYIKTEGKAYVKSWMSDGKASYCPEGAILLPIDIWQCKITNLTCPVQAYINLEDNKSFFQYCEAPEERKVKIFNSIKNKNYNGFHHVPGRSLCISCENIGMKRRKRKRKESSSSFFYHYPWELARLDIVLNLSDIELKNLIMHDVKVHDSTHPLCPPCCKDLAKSIDVKLYEQLEVFEFEVDLRK